MAHQIGFIGLGKMGKQMVLHLAESGIDVVSFNRTPIPEATVSSIEALVKKVAAPRVIWLMIPNGTPVDETLEKLLTAGITAGDTIIDGGNTYYKDTVRRASEFSARGFHYIDSGTSGGLEGARMGACLMLGGKEEIVASLSWLWDAIAVKDGWGYMGPSGAGHFVKMVHNGVEYGMNQAIGEGLEIIAKSPYHIDLTKVAQVWNHGSIVRSYLVELLAQALQKDPELATYTGKVGGGETGGWALAAAREFGVAAPVLEQSLAAREKSQTVQTVSSKVVSALRRGYGGHEEIK